ncbi:MAG: hypothetical protein ACLTG4_03015 [Oscillospiraceae bacterium]
MFRTVAALGDELADGRIDPDPCIRDAKDKAPVRSALFLRSAPDMNSLAG